MAKIKKTYRDYGEMSEDPAGGKYGKRTSDLLDDYLSRGEFDYDPESDPLYASYRDSYLRQGSAAMKDVYAEASTLTGGYGNSYAASAGAQAYGEYLDRLNDRLPELYEAAYDRYSDSLDEAYRKYGASSDYYSDLLDRYYNDREFFSGYDQQEYENAYNEYADDLAYRKWLEEFEYDKSRDEVADEQWEREYAYNKSRDETEDEQWERRFQLDRYRYR